MPSGPALALPPAACQPPFAPNCLPSQAWCSVCPGSSVLGSETELGLEMYGVTTSPTLLARLASTPRIRQTADYTIASGSQVPITMSQELGRLSFPSMQAVRSSKLFEIYIYSRYAIMGPEAPMLCIAKFN